MIPFLDLKAQYQSIKPELDAAVIAVLESCQYVLGPEVAAFEQEFADQCGVRAGIALNSGTSALHLALLAADIGPGDEVITIPFTFVATVAAIRYAGATPVFVDVDPVSYTMDPARLEAAITSRTRAVMPVHLYGQPADMDPIVEIARRHNLVVIEDAAQAHAAEYKGRRVGSLGDMACFSFYPGKNLGACGEGGIVVTDSEEWTRKIRMMRDWGQEKKYHHDLPGYNYRMEGVQGAALRVKLRRLEDWTASRRSHAMLYDELLAPAKVGLPRQMDHSKHVYHIYAVLTPARDTLQQTLQACGIQTGIHYPIPAHLVGAHRDLGYAKGDFPVSERLASETLSLPMFAELSDAQIREVADAVIEAVG